MTRLNSLTIEVNQRTGSVTLRMQRRTEWGRVDSFQFTLPRDTFERALEDADVVVPWRAVL